MSTIALLRLIRLERECEADRACPRQVGGMRTQLQPRTWHPRGRLASDRPHSLQRSWGDPDPSSFPRNHITSDSRTLSQQHNAAGPTASDQPAADSRDANLSGTHPLETGETLCSRYEGKSTIVPTSSNACHPPPIKHSPVLPMHQLVGQQVDAADAAGAAAASPGAGRRRWRDPLAPPAPGARRLRTQTGQSAEGSPTVPCTVGQHQTVSARYMCRRTLLRPRVQSGSRVRCCLSHRRPTVEARAKDAAAALLSESACQL